MRYSGVIAVGERQRGRAPRVLVLEDDDDLRVLIAETLRTDGFEVIETGEGIALDELLEAEGLDQDPHDPPFDLVVCDLLLPNRSGIDVLEDMQQAGWSVPIVVVTGVHDMAMQNHARKLGAAAVFHKPFEVDDLRMAVLNLMPASIEQDPASRRHAIPVSPH